MGNLQPRKASVSRMCWPLNLAGDAQVASGREVLASSHLRSPRSWQVHFQGLLVRVRVSRLSKGKLEGSWLRRLFSRWTCFSVVTPRKAPSEN